MKESPFEIRITESESGIEMVIMDYETRQTTSVSIEDDEQTLSLSWMAKYLFDNCKKYMRMTPEELKKRAQKLKEDDPFA